MFSAALYARVHFFCATAPRDRGCSAHPVFPAPSDWREESLRQTSGAMRREIAKLYQRRGLRMKAAALFRLHRRLHQERRHAAGTVAHGHLPSPRLAAGKDFQTSTPAAISRAWVASMSATRQHIPRELVADEACPHPPAFPAGA